MASVTVRNSSCPSVRKHSRRWARQEAIESSRSGALSETIVDEGRSALDTGARKMLQAALEVEVNAFVEEHASKLDEGGRRRVVRNGYLPARTIMTGAGPLEVEQPRVRDKAKDTDERIVFSSAILPPYLRKSRSVEELVPWLYLKGISTGDFPEALQSLIGSDAKGFSPNVVVRLKETWGKEYDDWNRRDLSKEEYVYVWADGIRESKQSWVELLLDLKQRGLTKPPRLAVGDGALGFWAALREVYPATKEQRCWVHKTANVLNKMPKGLQPKAKGDLHQIWLAETRESAIKAFDFFLEKYGVKYEAACACLSKDRDSLLAFYDFPAEHWGHLRTTNPIESTFATIRLTSRRTKGSGSRKASLMMMFKLAQSASKRWRRLNAHHQIVLVLEGRIFTDGVMQNAA